MHPQGRTTGRGAADTSPSMPSFGRRTGAGWPRRSGRGGAARLAGGADRLAASLAHELRVHLAHSLEDGLRRRLRLLLGRLLHLLELERLAELDRDLGELQALPVARALGAGDRRRHHRHARLEREPAEAVTRLAELAAPR